MTTAAAQYLEERKRQQREAWNFGKYVQFLVAAKGDLLLAAELSRGYPLVQSCFEAQIECGTKSLEDVARRGLQAVFPGYDVRNAVAPGVTSDSTWAGPLAPLQTVAAEFTSAMYPLSALLRLPVRRVPFQIRFVRTSAQVAAATFIGEGSPLPLTSAEYELITLPFAKLGALSVVSDELARSSAPSAPSTVAADIGSSIGAAIDRYAFDPDQDAVSNVSPKSLTFGATQITSSGSTFANIMADLKRALQALDNADVPLSQCYFVISQSVALHLATLRTTNDEAAFEDFSLAGDGKLFGLPAIVSGAVFGSGSPSEGLIVALHPDSIAVADDGSATVDVSQEAALEFDTAPSGNAGNLKSLWGENLTALKVQRFINYVRRRDNAVVTIRSLNV